jgi:plastocyanin
MRRILALVVLAALPLTAAALAPLPAGSDAVSPPVTMSFLTGFSPPVVVVSSGQAVTWTNTDTVKHTVTDCAAFAPLGLTSVDLGCGLGGAVGTFNSGTLSPGASFTRSFAGPAVVLYHCAIHPNMWGVVVVTP